MELAYYGPQERGHCGYCSAGGARSWGMRASKMSCGDYQALIDRGWRRYCLLS